MKCSITHLKILLKKTSGESPVYRMEQVEDRISEIEDKIEELKQLDKYKEKCQENINGTSKTNGTLLKVKATNQGYRRRRDTNYRHRNIFNKIIAENLPNLDREHYLGTAGFQITKKKDQKRNTTRRIRVKTLNIQKNTESNEVGAPSHK
jgi:vacuolar-type H+-ATPase subunit I/STV1